MIATIVAVIITVSIIILVLTGKNPDKIEPEVERYAPPAFVKNINNGMMPLVCASTLPVNPVINISQRDAQKDYRKRITLTKLSTTDKEIINVGIEEELYISVNSAGNRLIVAEDMRINEACCRILYDGENLSIVDIGSEGGIYVNGIPINRKFYLANDDDIFIANNKWRINF